MPNEETKTLQLLENLVALTQDLLILQALEAGMKNANVRALVGVETSRVNRVSKLRPKNEEA
jgi:hypothetical protein